MRSAVLMGLLWAWLGALPAPAISADVDAEAAWLRYPAISPDGETIVFSYRGDLWRVSSAGGTAVPLTMHAALDRQPVWSRDGSKIAFASNRYGNFDVWVMPAAGGRATRLTYHSADDRPTAFTAGDDAVLFASTRLDAVDCVQFPTGAQPELYEVALAGGMPRQVLTTPALDARPDRAGRRIAYTDRKGYENPWRKHDDSSFARDLWLYDALSGRHRRLTAFGHDDRGPRWSPDERSLYYLSEASGTFNVWRLQLGDAAQPEQITRHDTHPVRFLSVSAAGDIAYAYDGAIWVRAAGASTSRRLQIRAPADLQHNARRLADVASRISEFDVSPDGGEIAFVARGEVFVTSTEHGATRRITDTPEQERSVSFSPDGRSLLYASERDRSWNLYRTDLVDEDEPRFFNGTALEEKPVLEIGAETFQPRFSPDGKEVAYLEERTTLKVLNLESGESRTILPGDRNYSYVDGDQWYAWAPDGRNFLVQFLSPQRWSREIGLVPASGGGDVKNLTRSGYEDIAARWSLDGEAMYWYTDRYGGRLERGSAAEYDLRLAFFTTGAWDRYRMTEYELEQAEEREEGEEGEDKEEDSDGEDDNGDAGKKEKDKKKGRKGGKKGDDHEEDDKPAPIDFELDRLDDRTIRLTTHSSRMGSAVLTPDAEKLLYLARFEKGYDLWSYEHREQKVELVAKLNAKSVGGLTLDDEGEKAFMLVDGSLRAVDVASAKVEPVTFSATMNLDPAAERDYLFEHVWRQTLKKFHDVDMHGVDWTFFKNAYRRFLPHVDTDPDFAELLSEMLGELNASHTGAYASTDMEGPDRTAALGLFPDPDWKRPGIRIVEILEESPLQQTGTRITAGTVVTAIDGETIAAGENWHPLLNHRAGKPVRLSLRDPENDQTWQEVVKPIGIQEEHQLLYERWVESRRAEVERLSDGRLGYAHIRGMNEGSFRDVFEETFGESVDKEAIILDTRFNGGGNLDEILPIFLSGETYMRATPRGQPIGSIPARRWTKPSIMIQNEGNYSDAHCVPNAYRSLGLGKTVGMQVPGTCTSVWWERQQNPNITFGIPQVTWLDNEGDPLENKHFDPDYEVDNDPHLEAAGRDQQLERAVEVLLDQLDG